MPTRLPTLVKRLSRPPSVANVDAANAPSAEEISPASAVVSKPPSVLTRFGTTFFNRKTMAVTKTEVNATATPSRPQRAALAGARPQIVRRGSTETDLSSSLPEGEMTRLLQPKMARTVLKKANSTLSTVASSMLPPPLKPQISTVDEALIAGSKDSKNSESRVPDEHQAADAPANPPVTLDPHRPPAENGTDDGADGSFGSVVPRRPILSKRMSASESNMMPANATLPPQKSGSFRNLLRFDRSKTGLGPASTAATLPSMSQKSVRSMRDSGNDSSETQQLPAQFVLDNFGNELTPFEKQEITKFPDVYYYASTAIKSRRHNGKIIESPSVDTPEAGNPTEIQLRPTRVELHNDGYDDEHGDYVMLMQDHLGYRYEVLHPLGSGSFGQVVCCVDHATKTKVAVKVIRNRKKYKEQAMIEIQVLTQLQEQIAAATADPAAATAAANRRGSKSFVPPSSPYNVVQMIDSFVFRNHLCITFELLGMNLYEYLKLRFFQGMPMENIRIVTRQLLHALAHLRTKHIIHCDLKPENVLIKTPLQCFGAGPGRSSVAYANVPIENVCLIDFGSSCLDSATMYTYIQSRFYRSPEVILGYPYGMPIDMWSLGCIVVELYTGHPIFAGENETEQLMCMMEILGIPPTAYLAKSKRRRYFFQEIQAADPNASAGTSAAGPTVPLVNGVTPATTATPAATAGGSVTYRPLAFTNSRGRRRVPGMKDLVSVVKCDDEDFVSFVRKCFAWDPSERLTPEAALEEPWLTKEGVTEAEG